MVKKLLQKYLTWRNTNDAEPWASFEIVGFEDDGRVKVTFNWNKAFIDKIYSLGFRAETEDDSVQLFYYTSQMRPTTLDGAEESEAKTSGHPNLQSDTHQLRT